jgi:hypothetical protein
LAWARRLHGLSPQPHFLLSILFGTAILRPSIVAEFTPSHVDIFKYHKVKKEM